MTNIENLKGKWTLDSTHSEFGFTVRHAGISKVRGRFNDVAATINAEDSIEDAAVNAIAKVDSFDSGDAGRDAHVKGPDFFDIELYPELSFSSTSLKHVKGEEFKLDGNLTIRDVTLPVSFEVELHGTALDPFGNARAGLSGKTVISRKDFGLTWNAALETGGVLVGDKVTVILELSFIKE
jgi:polyisoprenoid-binding protein YceI